MAQPNFIKCPPTRQTPHADIEQAHHSACLVHLANNSYRVGKQQLLFDGTTERFTNSEAANALLKPAYRDKYRVLMRFEFSICVRSASWLDNRSDNPFGTHHELPPPVHYLATIAAAWLVLLLVAVKGSTAETSFAADVAGAQTGGTADPCLPAPHRSRRT